jgi:hypothetical protein
MFGSPKRTIFTPSPEDTQTADFFGPPGVLHGLFKALPLHGPEVLFGILKSFYGKYLSFSKIRVDPPLPPID